MDLNEEQLFRSKTIAVVGRSAKPDRPSQYVAKHLQEHGFRVIRVNPRTQRPEREPPGHASSRTIERGASIAAGSAAGKQRFDQTRTLSS